ncbi:RICIN domain-containing protein [Solihabitans fulvus]|uniref:RICIN domain-containing protein n=1 Tax=Solihabitans fulvus TaxID=1892852 RepID=A0A5B2X3V2_9PSEU|nr:RICIN domain-containing protein [Solihabitans fulvus]KAA2257914.1 RICIN domain-containing protein [Solihabitans fulvus]
MSPNKRLVGWFGIAAVVAGTTLAVVAPAQAAAPRAAEARQITLRLASQPDQVANVAGASKENGAQVIQWPLSQAANERWEPESTLDGYYRFKSVNSGLCLNVRGGGSQDGAPVIQYTCGGSANELWRFVQKGIGYQVVSKSSGKCLNVRGGVGQGRELIQYTCVGGGAPNDVWLPVWEHGAS